MVKQWRFELGWLGHPRQVRHFLLKLSLKRRKLETEGKGVFGVMIEVGTEVMHEPFWAVSLNLWAY